MKERHRAKTARSTARLVLGCLGITLLVPTVIAWLSSGFLLFHALLKGDAEAIRWGVGFVLLSVVGCLLADIIARLLWSLSR